MQWGLGFRGSHTMPLIPMAMPDGGDVVQDMFCSDVTESKRQEAHRAAGDLQRVQEGVEREGVDLAAARGAPVPLLSINLQRSESCVRC